MGVKYSQDFGNIFSWLNAKVTGTEAAAQNTVLELVETGEAEMKMFTSSRPSSKSGKTGRIETTAMLNAIGSKITESSLSRVAGEYGFIDAFEDYFKYQTVTGFVHWKSSEFIEPTYALRDAFENTVQNAPRIFESNMRGV